VNSWLQSGSVAAHYALGWRELLAHYTAVADAIEIPIMYYNLPSASGVKLTAARATHQQNFETYDTSYLSVVNLARRFSRLVGLSEPAMVPAMLLRAKRSVRASYSR
jgi:hypothetical protein